MDAHPPSPGPRRTRDRILETALRLFNELGEQNVTTTTIAEEMEISPGNLYYHFRNKDDIITSIFSAFEAGMEKRLRLPEDHHPTVEEAWAYLQYMADFLWQYRFLYRDINDLLARNRILELHFKRILEHKLHFARDLLHAMQTKGELSISLQEIDMLCTNLTVISTYWLNYQYVLNPRQYNDQQAFRTHLHAVSYHVFSMLAPYLRGHALQVYKQLAQTYLQQPH